MAQCRGLFVFCFFCCFMFVLFLTDGLIHSEKRMMTVPQKVTVTISSSKCNLCPLSLKHYLSLAQPVFCVCLCTMSLLSCVSFVYSPWVYAVDKFVCGWCLYVSTDSLLQQVFAVRFLGSMAVRCGNNPEVIYEAMRQVLAARAIHNIFRTTESHLMVTSSSLR